MQAAQCDWRTGSEERTAGDEAGVQPAYSVTLVTLARQNKEVTQGQESKTQCFQETVPLYSCYKMFSVYSGVYCAHTSRSSGVSESLPCSKAGGRLTLLSGIHIVGQVTSMECYSCCFSYFFEDLVLLLMLNNLLSFL